MEIKLSQGRNVLFSPGVNAGVYYFFDKNIFLLYNSTMSQIDYKSNIIISNLLPSPGEFFIFNSNLNIIYNVIDFIKLIICQ